MIDLPVERERPLMRRRFRALTMITFMKFEILASESCVTNPKVWYLILYLTKWA